MSHGKSPDASVQGWLYRSASDRHAGRVDLENGEVTFRGDEATFELPVAGLHCRPGGLNDGTIFLSHAGHGSGEIAVERTVLARHTELASLPAVASALEAAPRLVRRHRIFWGCVAVATLIGLGLVTTLLMALWRSLF